jgi:hypothetical protein
VKEKNYYQLKLYRYWCDMSNYPLTFHCYVNGYTQVKIIVWCSSYIATERYDEI